MADINRALTEPVAAVDGSTTVCFLDNAEGLALSVKAFQNTGIAGRYAFI